MKDKLGRGDCELGKNILQMCQSLNHKSVLREGVEIPEINWTSFIMTGIVNDCKL